MATVGWFVIGVVLGLVLVVVLAACMLSSGISQREEYVEVKSDEDPGNR